MADEQQFVHLHLHSEYSLLDGLSPVKELVGQAAKLGMPALALTDHGVMYGAIEFYLEAQKKGIKPIVGVEAYIAPRGMTDRSAQDRQYSHLVLLARDATGYKNLLKLVSRSHLEGYFYRPRIDRELLAQHHEGLIALSACPSGDVARGILRDDLAAAREAAGTFRDIMGADSFYLELQSHGLTEPDEAKIARGKLQLGREMGIPVVATNDVHYTHPEGHQAQDLLLCIQTNSTIEDPKRMRMDQPAFYLKTPQEMWRLFGEIPQSLTNTLAIAEQCDLELKFDRLNFPELGHVIPAGMEPQAYLEQVCRRALPERYGGSGLQAASERLEYELDVIRTTGFAAYILFVWDFVRWAREQQILCGPRGSAAGAIVLYLLGITQVEPLEYGLTFERFLNPERVQMPDIDMDFPDDRRQEVIEYVVGRYGRDHVAQIVTFGRLQARAAIRDVGRAMSYQISEVDRVAKLIPTIPIGITIAQALETNTELRTAYEGDPRVKRLIDAAQAVEGVARHASTHAAGVVVAGEPLVEHVPLQKVAKSDDGVMCQYSMKVLEKIGLLKMDFLGLANLTMLDKAVGNIKRVRGIEVDPVNLPLDDQKTYDALARGETKTVFQLEGGGMTRYLKELQPQTVHHLSAMVALYRPGPMAQIPEYIARKEGRAPVIYPHPSLEPVLKDSYGLLVYQDQVLQVVQIVAGYSLGQADILRRAMGKKLADEMKRERQRFLEGAAQRGYSNDVANQLWEYIEPFAGYAFNKCVLGTTRITEATTGERTTVGELFANPRPFAIHALGADGKLRPRRVTDVLANGVKPVFELRTAQGHRIVATGNHPFRTLDGWTNLEHLRVGDRVAAPRRLPVPTEERWPRHELVALAGLLSEGNTCHPSSLYFYNNDRAPVNDFAAAAEAFPDTVARVTQRDNGRYVVCLNTGRDARFRKGDRPWNAAGGATVAEVEATPLARSGAYAWAERLGITWKKATEKVIPDEVFRLRDADLEVFLGRLWSGDGFLANATNSVPFYATSSRELAYGVQALLLRLGIVSGIHPKTFAYAGGPKAGWTVHLVGEGSVEAFVRRVVPHVVGREAAVERLRAHLADTERGRTSLDTVPPGVHRWVDDERQAAGLTWKAVGERSGVALREFYGIASPGKHGFRRATIRRLAAFFGSERLAQAADSDVFWDRVVAIEPRGTEPTYDLTVEEDHNFVADGLIVHNSHAVMYAHIAYQTAYLKANFPVEWMAAVLTTEATTTEKVVSVVGECRRLGIPILPPDINKSEAFFDVQQIPGTFELKLGIRYGLSAVKNVGEGAVEHIIAERQRGGAFRSFDEFCRRVDLKTVNKRVIDALSKSGALDPLGTRERVLAGIDQCMSAAQAAQKASSQGQTSLFDDAFGGGGEASAGVTIELPAAEPWAERQRLLFEKEALGLYISSHPFQQAAVALADAVSCPLDELGEEWSGQKVTLAGIVTTLRRLVTKKGDSMLVAELEDLSGSVEVVAFPRTLEKTNDLWREDAVLIVEGKFELRDDRPQVICETAREWNEGDAVAALGGASGESRPRPARPAASGNGQANGRNGHANGANGYANGSNGHAGGNGARRPAQPPATASRTPPPAPPRPASATDGPPRVRITVPRTGNHVDDIRLLEALNMVLREHPGDDRYEMVISAGKHQVKLDNPSLRIAWSPELEGSLRSLLGSQHVEPLAAPEPAAAPVPEPPVVVAAPGAGADDGAATQQEAASPADDAALDWADLDGPGGAATSGGSAAPFATDELESVRNWWGED